MHLQRLPSDEAAVRRYVEDLWLPYHRELEATVDERTLAEDVDLVAEEVEYRRGRLQEDDYRAWVAVDGAAEDIDVAAGDGDFAAGDGDFAAGDGDFAAGDEDFAAGDGALAGFVTTEVDESPSVFDRPTRLVIGDIYVTESYSGSGLARDLVDRAAERARNADCAELALDVDVDNERALAFYEKHGFEALRYRMTVGVDDL